MCSSDLTSGDALQAARAHMGDLREILNVSELDVAEDATFAATVVPAGGSKCERCWHWESDVGQVAAHPSLCGRCAAAVSVPA